MSPSSFRPLLDADYRRRGGGQAPGWVPDPLLGPHATEQDDPSAHESRTRPFAPSEPVDDEAGAEDPQAAESPASRRPVRQFELLGMERLTGEPVRESWPAGLGDGFEFEAEPGAVTSMGEAASGDAIDLMTELLPEASTAMADADAPLERLSAESGSDGSPPEVGVAPSPGSTTDSTQDGSEGNAGGLESQPPAEPPVPEQPQVLGIPESEHHRLLEEALAAEREVAFAAGLEKGLADGLKEGLARGEAQARESMKADTDRKQQALDALIQGITEASLDPVALHGPLRRLAVHLATELVRGELSQSSEAIGRLVETCLAEVDRAPGDHLVLAMHPDDLERWIREPALPLDRVELRADPAIGPGSVRLSAGDTVIEDLIEHRLAVLATRVLGEAAALRLPRLGALRARGFADGEIADVG